MKLDASVLAEPPLEFAGKTLHWDPREGIRHFGPSDLDTIEAPSRVRIALVGLPEDNDSFCTWVESVRDGAASKGATPTALHPDFPGHDPTVGFRCPFVIDPSLTRNFHRRRLERIVEQPGPAAVVELTGLYLDAIDSIVDTATPEVIVCVRPSALLENEGDDTARVAFHDLLKAKAMAHGIPLQVVRADGWEGEDGTSPAERAWNLFTALYYKAGGTPWRLPHEPDDPPTAYVGVSFFRRDDRDELHASAAKVFDRRGDGVVIRGGQAIRKPDKTPGLTEETSHKLLSEVLHRYGLEHQRLPGRVVVHKTSRFSDAETAGFTAAADDENLHDLELVWVQDDPPVQLFSEQDHSPLRGTTLRSGADSSLLYTTGTVPGYGSYPGPYVPRPIALHRSGPGRDPITLARETLALTKMNWNSTRYDGRLPITLQTSRKVGQILRHLPTGGPVQARYAHYM